MLAKILKNLSVAFSAVALLSLSGCTTDMGELNRYIEEVNQRPGGRIAPIPKIKEHESYVYSAQKDGLRSPFRLPEVISAGPIESCDNEFRDPATGKCVGPDTERNREPLEEYPLDALRMVGSLDMENTSYGLVQDPEGLIHQVKKGDYVGTYYGKVVRVTPTEIVLTESVNRGGSWQSREAAIALNEEQ